MRLEALLLLCLALGGMCMDLYSGKIQNGWILAGWLVGAFLQTMNPGISGFVHFLSGSLFPVILLFPLFWFRMLGAGDIKLLSVLGGITGVHLGMRLICCSFILGAIISLLILIICQNLEERIQYLFHYFSEYRKTGKKVPYRISGKRKENFPFTIPIFLATVLYIGGLY